MLYLIIPPIIIIVSLVLLLFLLSRKSSEFQKIENQSQDEGFFRKNVLRRIKNIDYSRFNQFFLRLLEKITSKFKIISLKFHNITDKWFHSIKRKREINGSNKETKEPPADKKDDVEKEKPVPVIIEEEEKIAPPMVSAKATKPESKTIVKNEFERLLIERIAVNPKDIEAYERLGDYYMEQENSKDAIECYEQVLRLNPGHYQAKIRLKRLHRISDK